MNTFQNLRMKCTPPPFRISKYATDSWTLQVRILRWIIVLNASSLLVHDGCWLCPSLRNFLQIPTVSTKIKGRINYVADAAATPGPQV